MKVKITCVLSDWESSEEEKRNQKVVMDVTETNNYTLLRLVAYKKNCAGISD